MVCLRRIYYTLSCVWDRMMLTSGLNLGCAVSESEWIFSIWSHFTSFREVKGQNIYAKVKRIRHGNTFFMVRFPGVLWCAESNSQYRIMLKCHFDLIWISWRSKHKCQGQTYYTGQYFDRGSLSGEFVVCWIEFRVQNNAKMSFLPDLKKPKVKTCISRSNAKDGNTLCVGYLWGLYGTPNRMPRTE